MIFLISVLVQMSTVFKFRWFVAEFSSALCLFWLCVWEVSHFENNRISSPGVLLLFTLVLGYPPFLTVIKSDWKMSRHFDLCLFTTFVIIQFSCFVIFLHHSAWRNKSQGTELILYANKEKLIRRYKNIQIDLIKV